MATIQVSGVALALCLWASGAIAQTESLHRSAEAVANKPLRIGIYGNVKKDCAPGPLPEVKVTTPPKHGTLAVRTGKVKTNRVANCPNLETPIQGVFYQARAGYTGVDEIGYEVRSAEGKVQSHSVRINVTSQANPKAKPSDATDL